MTDVAIQGIVKKLKAARKILLATHYDPDGDCLGSTLALALALRRMNKKIALVCADKLPPLYLFLPQPRLWQTKVPGQIRFDAGVVVDCANPDRLGWLKKPVMTAPFIINIDHHGDNSGFGQLNYAKPAAAAGLHVYQILKALKVKITPDIAAALYVAIITDTGGFRFGNTDEEVLRVCSELVKAGARPGRIAKMIYENFPPSQIKLAGLIYQRLKTLAGGRIAYSWLTKKDLKNLKMGQADLGNPVDYLRLLGGVEIVLFFREAEDGLVKVNFRSKGRTDVRALAQVWDGGGHRSAAGATIKGGLVKMRTAILRQTQELFD